MSIETRAAGFQVHVSKPVDAGNLIDSVASLVENQTIY